MGVAGVISASLAATKSPRRAPSSSRFAALLGGDAQGVASPSTRSSGYVGELSLGRAETFVGRGTSLLQLEDGTIVGYYSRAKWQGEACTFL